MWWVGEGSAVRVRSVVVVVEGEEGSSIGQGLEVRVFVMRRWVVNIAAAVVVGSRCQAVW